jgi:hypothetical protein
VCVCSWQVSPQLIIISSSCWLGALAWGSSSRHRSKTASGQTLKQIFYFCFFVRVWKIGVGLVIPRYIIMSDSAHLLLIQIPLCSIFLWIISFDMSEIWNIFQNKINFALTLPQHPPLFIYLFIYFSVTYLLALKSLKIYSPFCAGNLEDLKWDVKMLWHVKNNLFLDKMFWYVKNNLFLHKMLLTHQKSFVCTIGCCEGARKTLYEGGGGK